MKASVIVLTHAGREAFLPWLRFNLMESAAGFELVVVADADCADAVRRELKELSPTVVATPPGAGVGAKRNLGLKAAREEAIFFLDDDDWLHPRRIDITLSALEDAELAGAGRGWFLDVRSLTACRYAIDAPIQALSGVRRATALRVPPHDGGKKASDTRWMNGLMRRLRPADVKLLEGFEGLFLQHGKNLHDRKVPQGPSLSNLLACVDGLGPRTLREVRALRSRLGVV